MSAFNRLNNRFIISGKLAFNSAVHIGDGSGDERADQVFARSNGEFYLPGSSIRGALRTAIERMAASLALGSVEDGKISCFLDSGSGTGCFSVNRNVPNLMEQWRQNGLSGKEIFEKINDNNLCRLCRLFGSPYLASKVKVMDSFPVSTLPEKAPVRTGIGIDRDTESVREGALFEVEVLDTKPEFSFEIIAENLDLGEPFDWGLLSLGLIEFQQGNITLGAKSAVGMGNCCIKDIKIEGFENSEELKTFLSTRLYSPKKNKNSYQKFLENKLKDFLDVFIPKSQVDENQQPNADGKEE